jgi:hypothetical protein
MAFLGHRIADKRMLSYKKRLLRAGIQEDGRHKTSERGRHKCCDSPLFIRELFFQCLF